MTDLVSRYFLVLVVIAMASFLAMLGYQMLRDATAAPDPVDRD